MHGCVGRAVWAAIAISLYALPASAVEASGTANALVNSPEQVRKAQVELQRLDCLRGRVDGKLGDQTRQAVKKFWKSAGQPILEVSITDELISDLADRGAGFCRPARRFFAVGAPLRPGGSPPFMRRPAVPATPVQAPAPAQ
jgi:peptidoglycan hydrolase-like protein with peptidoglycan-binding domain